MLGTSDTKINLSHTTLAYSPWADDSELSPRLGILAIGKSLSPTEYIYISLFRNLCLVMAGNGRYVVLCGDNGPEYHFCHGWNYRIT